MPPVETKIWVQVGAFHVKTSATAVLSKIKEVGRGSVDGQSFRQKVVPGPSWANG